MSTRFYLEPTTAATVSPSFDAGWEQTGQAVRRKLIRKTTVASLTALADSATITVPITTTQDILCAQFVSDPIPTQRVIGTFSFINRVFESATTANVSLAIVLYVVSQDGGTVRGTLFSTFNVDTEWAVAGSPATRIQTAAAITELSTQPGDRLVLEIGGHAAAPSAATSYNMRFGYNAASDFALTTALTTDLNPWMELSQDIWDADTNNYQFVRVGSGLSTTERIR